MFSFGFDTIALVQFQESCEQKYRNGQSITSSEMSQLKNCLWVSLAAKLAPCNIVIRQWALIDIFSNDSSHKDGILRILEILSYGDNASGMRVWAEGYYYFWYTMCILQLWIDKFGDEDVKRVVGEVRKGLTVVGYYRDGIMYGAPCGDIRDVPLDNVVEMDRMHDIVIGNIGRVDMADRVHYKVQGWPIGFNLHVPKDDYEIDVISGIPIGFKFYDGWDKKYSSKWAEMMDMLSWKRVKSLASL